MELNLSDLKLILSELVKKHGICSDESTKIGALQVKVSLMIAKKARQLNVALDELLEETASRA